MNFLWRRGFQSATEALLVRREVAKNFIGNIDASNNEVHMMLAETYQSIGIATRQVIRKWRSLLLLAATYAAFLVSLYLFVSIREASITQVAFTLALAIAAPVLFLELQAISASCTSELKSSAVLKKSLTDVGKLLLISLPVIALAVGAVYLLGKIQVKFGAPATSAINLYNQYPLNTLSQAADATARPPLQWSVVMILSLRYLILGLLLPLGLVQLWIATVHEGLKLTIIKARDHILRAFAPQSVLIFMSGFVVFGIIPYLLLYRTIATQHAWLDIGLFVGRIGAIFALTLFGWVATMTALAISAREDKPKFTRQVS